MPIKDIGGINQVLQNHNASSWKNNANLNLEGMASLQGIKTPEIGGGKQTFGEMLASSISNVNNLQHQANDAIEKLVTGKSRNLHETMLAVEQAEIAFKTMNQVRQKVIDAYHEVMRMQV